MTWVVAAAVAGQLAWVAAPMARAGVDPHWLHLLAPTLLAAGLLRRSQVAMLVGVPLGWAAGGYVLPASAFASGLSLVGVAATFAYFVTALRWLRGRPELRAVEWAADAPPGRDTRDPMPWVAGFLVGGPALGVVLWPAIPRAAAAGFPGQPGRVTVALALLGTLVGLALATDLARGRPALVGDLGRARWLGLATAISLGLWAGLGI